MIPEIPGMARHEAEVQRVNGLQSALQEVDTRIKEMKGRLDECVALIDLTAQGAPAATINKTEAAEAAETLPEAVAPLGTVVKNFGELLEELVKTSGTAFESLRNVKELQRMYADYAEKVMDMIKKLEEQKRLLDQRDALVLHCDGKRLKCPKWLPDKESLLLEQELPLNIWVQNEKRTRYHTDRIRECHTLLGTVEVIKDMYRAEEEITAKVVKSWTFYNAVTPFVPKDNVDFFKRRKVRDAISSMVQRENKKLRAEEMETDPNAAHRRGEALIKHAEEQDRVRLQREKVLGNKGRKGEKEKGK